MMVGMALDIIILSILRSGPVHGYELKRRAQRPSLADLSNNSIYPYLRRFEDAGAVTHELEAQEKRPPRKVYSITEPGRRLLLDLISTLPLELAADDEEFLVRMSFFHEIAPANRRAILAARTAVVDAAIARVDTLVGETSAVSDQPTRAWRAVAMTEILHRMRAERDWIDTLTEKADHDDVIPFSL